MDSYIDIHSHILPEMDDGAQSWNDAIEMCKIAANDGIKTIVATPHINKGVYWYSEEKISKKAEELQKSINDLGIKLRILTGADVHFGPDTLAIIADGAYSINPGRKYVLIEFPEENLPHKIEDHIFNLMIKGIQPILTHPERNVEIQRNPQRLFELVSKGLLSQLTASSITGEFGDVAQKTSELLIKHRLAHFIATDSHSPTWRKPILSKAVKKASEYATPTIIHEMVFDNPQAVIRGESISPENPLEIKKMKLKIDFGIFKNLFNRLK